MYSIRELYRIGHGPSSSHTMGPANAAILFRQRFPQAQAFQVHLFGSLAATGRGHLTDVAIQQSLAPWPVSFTWQPEQIPAFHPNGMRLEALDPGGQVIGDWEIFSVGGGALRERRATGWLLSHNPSTAIKVCVSFSSTACIVARLFGNMWMIMKAPISGISWEMSGA